MTDRFSKEAKTEINLSNDALHLNSALFQLRNDQLSELNLHKEVLLPEKDQVQFQEKADRTAR
jgi:hypothetical protein